MNLKNKNKATYLEVGFTLIELLVVIAIISLLSSVALAAVRTATQKAQLASLSEDAHQILTQLDVVRAEKSETLIQITGNLCTECFFDFSQPMFTQIGALQTNDTAWKSLGFPNGAPLDPWGHPFLIDENENEINWTPPCVRHDVVYSTGPSGEGYGGDSTLAAGILYVDDDGPVGYYFNVPFFQCPEQYYPDGTQIYYNGVPWGQ